MKKYFIIIKPLIVFSNLFSFCSGFLFSQEKIKDYYIFFLTFLGIFFIISSSCVANNYIDLDIDRLMNRTKNRPSATNDIKSSSILLFSLFLYIVGMLFLIETKNFLSISLSVIGSIIYIVIYSLYLKRRYYFSILIGSISGAIPPVIGYQTSSNKIDIGTLILFITFFLWQIPHSYSMAIYNIEDYKKARIPSLPITKSIFITKIHISISILLFIISNFLFLIKNFMNKIFVYYIIFINLYWLIISVQGFKKTINNFSWSRKLFIFSNISIFFIITMIIFNSIKNQNFIF
ncbi:hypothetical protein AOQ88_00530 [Candidatus Riesia sp. GBBU]|nr:hypothetical protein AOQ88_00530 [Candidatus Riesia sp. GBBU]